MKLFEQFAINKKPRKKDNGTAVFIFDWDVDEQSGDIVGIIKDIHLRDSQGKLIRHSSLIREELSCVGWEAFIDRGWNGKQYVGFALNVSGRYRWEGTYWASGPDWNGEYDSGWEPVSLTPADRKTRKAIEAYGPGWDELVRC